MSQEAINKPIGNHAKTYQLVLFPFNNGATNVYFILTMNFIAYYANGVLGLTLIFATTMVTIMRLFDAITDPVIGVLIDKTQTRFGKFRPYMVMGNLIMAASAVLMYFGIRLVSADTKWLRYVLFVLFYALYVIGYTLQTACTRSGQTCLTNDPKQRPLFIVFNTVATLLGMGLIQFVAPVLEGRLGGYNSGAFFDVMVPMAIVISAILTILAVIGIWEKDQPQFYGVGGGQEKLRLGEYVEILRENKALQRLMITGAGNKLAFSVATNMTVLCMLYGSMMGNYGGLYLPMMILGYVFATPFFFLTVRVSQKCGQKEAVIRFTRVALLMYVGVLVLLLFWEENNPATMLSFTDLNWFTVVFVVLFGIGYGAYFSTADMPIPMLADCSDYETYRSGRYVPGIMGTLFSLVDKLVSSLSSTIVGLAVSVIGITTLPDSNTPYEAGMKWVVVVLFCVLPILAWIVTLIAMKGYHLTGERMHEIQEINGVRRQAIAEGMPLEEAMKKWQTSQDLKKIPSGASRRGGDLVQ